MFLFYFTAALATLIGLGIYFLSDRFAWWECLLGGLAAFLIAGMLHAIALSGMTADIETWSGQINLATFYPEWIEEYTVTHYTHDSKGNITGSYVTYHHTTHREYWEIYSNIETSYRVTYKSYVEICKAFGGQISKEKVYKSGFDGGDPHIYNCQNRTGCIIPITDTRRWENRIKAAPTVFSFIKVPKGIPVFDWPKTEDAFKSTRLLGSAANTISISEFDCMMAKLGPVSRVNVIMIGFGNQDSSIAQYQQAKFIGGKKNDLVLCYGGGTPTEPKWSFVFGWTENELVKRNLESILLQYKVDTGILPIVEAEIKKNYKLKDWSKFDYISIEAPTWAYWVFFIVMIGSQVGWYFFAYYNDADKEWVWTKLGRIKI